MGAQEEEEPAAVAAAIVVLFWFEELLSKCVFVGDYLTSLDLAVSSFVSWSIIRCLLFAKSIFIFD